MRSCRFVAQISCDISEFSNLFESATALAKGSDRWAEIQPGYINFHFENEDAYLRFIDLADDRGQPAAQMQFASRKYRLIILGAGFSKPAGFPLAADLWKEIRGIAEKFPSTHRASKFKDDLAHYIEFREATDGKAPDPVDFEDFMRFLDVEHYLGLRGGDTWSEDGNEGTIVTKFLIGKILARHVNDLKGVPDLYLEFAKRLDVNDTVFTFNYDTLLEQALDAVGKPYRLFSTRFKSVGEFSGEVDNGRDEIVVFKVHGSIDWFDRSQFQRRIADHKRRGAPPPEDIIFSNAAELGLQCIVDGPRPDTDPLKNVYRAKNLKALYAKDLLFLATPRILPPSAAKLLYATRMNDFWQGMGHAGHHNLGTAIVGFSLPTQDEYARQILYEWVTNYQQYNWDADEFGRKKAPLAIVDRFDGDSTKNKFIQRYRFVDWSRADLSGSGFDVASLDKIFA
jgi:hypothetical protein